MAKKSNPAFLDTPFIEHKGNVYADVKNQDFGAILISAVRYALGRQTYMPSLVIGFIRPIIPQLSDNDLTVMMRDIHEATPDRLGDPNIDAPGWIRFYMELEAEQKKRKETANP